MREGMELSDPGYSWSDKLLKLSGQLYAINEYKGKSSGKHSKLRYTVDAAFVVRTMTLDLIRQ